MPLHSHIGKAGKKQYQKHGIGQRDKICHNVVIGVQSAGDTAADEKRRHEICKRHKHHGNKKPRSELILEIDHSREKIICKRRYFKKYRRHIIKISLGERYCGKGNECQKKHRIAIKARREVHAEEQHHERYREKVKNIPKDIKKGHFTEAPLKSTYLSADSVFFERLIGTVSPFIKTK